MSEHGLVADLLSREPSNVKMICAFTRLLAALSDEERTAVENALERVKTDTGEGRARVYSYTWLADVLKKNGHPISSSTIARHVTGKCSCE
jgi:hypothetical protein